MKCGDQTVLIACSVLQAEIDSLCRSRWPSLRVRYLSSMLHMYPQNLDDQLQAAVAAEMVSGLKIVLVYGDCCPAMADLAESSGIARTKGGNCCELLLGREEYRRLEHVGVFFLLPEWARRWREIFRIELGLTHDNARGLMRDMHTRLMYLDTGILPVPEEDLAACSEYVGLPYEIASISLDNLALAIESACAISNCAEDGNA